MYPISMSIESRDAAAKNLRRYSLFLTMRDSIVNSVGVSEIYIENVSANI